MKKNELNLAKGQSVKELADKAKALRAEIANLVIDKNMKKIKDIKSGYKKRKDLAQVLTVIKQKQILSELETEISDQVKKESK